MPYFKIFSQAVMVLAVSFHSSGFAVAQESNKPCPSWIAQCTTQGCNGTPRAPLNNRVGSNLNGNYSETDFHGARLDSSRWPEGVDLSKSNFHGADLGNASLPGANL